MPIVVFDLTLLLHGLINPFSLYGHLIFGHAGRYRLVLSQALLVEFLEALDRPELVQRFRTLAARDRRRILDILSQAEVVVLPPGAAGAPALDNGTLMATARAAGASYVVSDDQALLVRKDEAGVRVIDCQTFLRVIEQGAR